MLGPGEFPQFVFGRRLKVPPYFGIDHDFPQDILAVVAEFLPFRVKVIDDISTSLIEDKDDWEVILALHQLGFDGLITIDYAMLELPKEMAVVHQTRSTLVAIEAAGDNPLRAMGQLMVHATSVARNFEAKRPQVFRIRAPRGIQPINPWDRLGEIASQTGRSIQEIYAAERLTEAELQRLVLPGA